MHEQPDTHPLRALRVSRGESTVALAAALGWDRSTVARVELGQVRPTTDLLVAVADHYGLTDDQLGEFIRSAAAWRREQRAA